jgi:outer membrane lipopolysaccharide assembly protein LptE/RlpB
MKTAPLLPKKFDKVVAEETFVPEPTPEVLLARKNEQALLNAEMRASAAADARFLDSIPSVKLNPDATW